LCEAPFGPFRQKVPDTFSLLVLLILPISQFPVHAQKTASPPTSALPRSADEAYARGDVVGGNKILNDLIAENPGNVDLAVMALHRICLEEFLELLDIDWVGMQMRRRLIQNHRGDLEKMRQVLSGHIRGALLRELENKSEHNVPPMNALRRATAASPINGGSEHYQYLIRETLTRRSGYPVLTPRDQWPDEAPRRLLALRGAGFVAPDHSAVVDATALLALLRRQQGRYREAIELMDELTAGCGNTLPWLLAQARFHALVESPRAAELFRQLFRRLDEDRSAGDIRQRAHSYARLLKGPPGARPGRPQNWFARMDPQDERDWAAVLRGRLVGREERVDRLIQQTVSDSLSAVYAPDKDGTGMTMFSSGLIDARLKSLGAEQLAGLRELQEAKCRVDRRAADLDGTSQAELLALFRRYRWAATAHRALQIYAQRELLAGHTEAAWRAFRDLKEHAADPQLRSKAQVGLWLATAQHRDPKKLAAAFEGIADDEKFPWMATEATAATIRRRLLQAMPASRTDRSDAPSLATLKPQLLKIPAMTPWPETHHRDTAGLDLVSIQPTGAGVLVSSRNILAWYDAHDTQRPVWTQLRRTVDKEKPRDLIGPFRPVVDSGRIYTRWGYHTRPSHLAALDATTGHVRWGTPAIDPSNLPKSVPLGHPVLSGGQLYDAHIRTGGQGSSKINLKLCCFDADCGALVWNSEIAIDIDKPRHGDPPRAVRDDVLTVCDGAIYCSPGGGVIFRCDTRDGRMQWMQRYQRKRGMPDGISLHGKLDGISLQGKPDVISPQGSKPIVAGDVLICLPRDAHDTMGLDCETGQILWKNPLLQPVEELGRLGDTLIVHGKIVQGRWVIAALEVPTGRVRWFTTLAEPIIGRAIRLGASVYVRTPAQLHRFDVATGAEKEVCPWPETDAPVSNFAIYGDRLYLLTNEPCVDPSRPGQPLNAEAAATAEPLRLPLQPCWELHEPDHKLFVPAEETLPEGRALLYSSESVQCVEITPRGGIAWQRIVGPRLQDVFFLDGKAVLFFLSERSARLEALDSNTGNSVWKTRLPAKVRHYDRSGTRFFVTHRDRLVTVDLASGKFFSRTTPVAFSPDLPEVWHKIQVGFGGGSVQAICYVHSRRQPSAMYWLTCDPLTDRVLGADEELRGLGGDMDVPGGGVDLSNAAFGARAAYFTARKNRPGIFRCDYKDRSVRMIRPHASIRQFDAPYLLLSTEPEKGDKLRTWVVLRDDEPSYEFSLRVENDWSVAIRSGWLIQTKGRRGNVLRVHDLQSRRERVAYTAEDAEYVGVLQGGPETLLVYSYHKHGKIRLTQYNFNSGSQGPTVEIPFPPGRKLEPSDVRVWRNMLLITNGESLRAWARANGEK